MGHSNHIQHGPRHHWRSFWRRTCRCGLGAYPCQAMVMRERQAARLPRRPAWNGRTAWVPTVRSAIPRTTPLLTPGQAARSERQTRDA